MTADEVFYRAAAESAVEGRTISGIAVPWESPALVRDPGRGARWEDFDRASFDRTIQLRGEEPWPLFSFHNHIRGQSAIGTAHLRAAAEGAVFEAVFSKTRAADEELELVKDGAHRDVSIGFREMRATKYHGAQGMVTRVLEAAMKELSTVPTGFGQIPGAKTLAVRATTPDDEYLALVQRIRADNLMRLRAGRPLLAVPENVAAVPTAGADMPLSEAGDETANKTEEG
jgi:phage head maturation protease